MNAPPESQAGSASLPRLVLVSAVLIVLVLFPVAVGWWLVGPYAAEAIYVGIVLMASVVTAVDLRTQLAAAVLIAVVAAAGAGIGQDLPLLLLAVVVTCALQIPFTLRSARAVAVMPAILVLFSLPPGQTPVLLTAAGTLIGALFMIGIQALARMPTTPQPVPRRDALLHAALLALGCCVLLLLAHWWQLPRTHWALLAFCLMFVPVEHTWRSGVRYAGATALGAVCAAAAGLLAPSGFAPILLLVAMIATVALTLAGRTELSVVPLVAAVVVMGTVLTEESMMGLGLQRTGMSLLALAVALLVLVVSQLVTRRLGQRGARHAAV